MSRDLIIGLWDAFPVSPGHALLVTSRHVTSWFDATPEEQHCLAGAIEHARQAIRGRYEPAGFNIGMNIGLAAGQTVPHLHLHVIPRYLGDVPDPRGGVRNVIPTKAKYWREQVDTRASGQLTTGSDYPLLPHLISHLSHADRADFVVSFVLQSGVDRIFPHLRDLLARGGSLRILTGDYLGITEPNALLRLLDLEGNVQTRVFETGEQRLAATAATIRSFHPKAYIFGSGNDGTAFVGSSNLSESALTTAVEWNYRVVSSTDRAGYSDVTAAFEALFYHAASRELTPDWIANYQRRRRVALPSSLPVVDIVSEAARPPAEPHEIQRAALEALEATRAAGNRAGLVVLATGLIPEIT